jgi:cytochrome b
MKKLRVWDLPLRLFHWALVVLIIGAIVSANIGGNWMEWHLRFGYAILTLALFRLVWGVAGSLYARFTQFIVGPRAILAYVHSMRAGARLRQPGHNPLAGLSVLGMLVVVLAQAISGLFVNDDIAIEGPLFKFISKDLSDRITWFHSELSINLLYAVIALHVLAIAFYLIRKKQDLLTPMLTGDVVTALDAPAANDGMAMRLLALAVLAACAGIVYGIVTLA